MQYFVKELVKTTTKAEAAKVTKTKTIEITKIVIIESSTAKAQDEEDIKPPGV